MQCSDYKIRDSALQNRPVDLALGIWERVSTLHSNRYFDDEIAGSPSQGEKRNNKTRHKDDKKNFLTSNHQTMQSI